MSLSIPRTWLLLSTTSLLPSRYIYSQSRQISLNPFTRKKLNKFDLEALEKLKSKKPAPQAVPELIKGDLAPSSIFEQVEPSTTTPEPRHEGKDKSTHEHPPLPSAAKGRDPKIMAAALDPRPHARRRWQRKMVIREIRGRYRLNKTEKLLRTERFHLSKSPWIKTSIKKLYPLARQIAGKPLSEAKIQMRFSKKKAAKDVLEHLKIAEEQAVVVKGMGLGKKGEKAEKVVVEDKKGVRRTIWDRTDMYVDEAWVGRGRYETEMDYRARGQTNRLRLPYTSISVVLKEEATRIRQAEEREAKRQRKKVWVPLPDRPITAQRQYPLW